MDISTFFQNLWQDYTAITPQATQIENLFRQLGESIVNDHVAFRTFKQQPIHLEALEAHLYSLGYQRFEEYRFPEKKLRAWSYIPSQPNCPRIFLSELECEAFSPSVQEIIQRLCAQVNTLQVQQVEVFWAGRLWQPILWEEYLTLQAESEYAAWVAALGLRPNHFTLSVNHLQKTPTLETVLDAVTQEGFSLNTAGGKIKGSQQVGLQQASTLADSLPVAFAGGEVHSIPTCYYEFAYRYPTAEGRLYQGFNTASANRIFESTHYSR